MIDRTSFSWPGWETVRLIGRGSFGAVYEIQRDVFGEVEKAALKVISIPRNASDIDEMYSEGYDEESITTAFQSHLKSIVGEYSLMRKMNGSANVVNCDDLRYVRHEDGIGWDIFIKMELLTPLTKALPAAIPEATVIRLGRDLCAALELCKKHGIIHRDIKPKNIFLSDNGDYKLGDFGIAKTVEKTMGGTKTGTYKYMAPEVYNNQPYGSAADIYSLGLVLYWMLNERRMPFQPLPPEKLTVQMDEHSRNRRLCGEPLPEPKNGSDKLKAIVLKACAYDPKERYASAAAMREDLERLETPGVWVDPLLEDEEMPKISCIVPDTDEEDKTIGLFLRDCAREMREDLQRLSGAAVSAPAVKPAQNSLAAQKPELPEEAIVGPVFTRSAPPVADDQDKTVGPTFVPPKAESVEEDKTVVEDKTVGPQFAPKATPAPQITPAPNPVKKKKLGIIAAVILALVIAVFVPLYMANSGFWAKNTVAAIIGETKLSNTQLNYYYVDAVTEFTRTYGSYAGLFGLDLSKPLNEQVIDNEAGTTWADDFTASALQNARETYALVHAAQAAGFDLPEHERFNIKEQAELNSLMHGYSSLNDYVKDYYGYGASEKSYLEYRETKALAQAYYAKYSADLTYDDAVLRAAEKGKEAEFSNFSYNYYYLNTSKFLQGGTTAEDGTTTYSEEEKAAAVKAAEEAAKALAQMEIASVEEFDAAIAAMTINVGAETAPKSTACLDYAYANVTAAAREWITDANRTAGELGYVENATTTTNEDGTENKTVNGYYVVYYIGSNDNKVPLANVRHILVTEGGKYDATTGQTTYTEEELAAAKEKAEKILALYVAGIRNEEAFAVLAKEHNTDFESRENGGLYENVHPNQMVEAVDNWCFAERRKPGNTDIIVTSQGVYIMYFVSTSEETYRDMLIGNTLRSVDVNTWYSALIEATIVTERNTKYLFRDLIISENRFYGNPVIKRRDICQWIKM